MDLYQLDQGVNLVPSGGEGVVMNRFQGALQLPNGVLPALQLHVELREILAEFQLLGVSGQGVVVVGDSLLVVVGLNHGFADFLDECGVSFALVDFKRLIEGLDGVSGLLDRQQSVPKNQVVLDGGLVVNNGLVAQGVGLFILSMFDVDIGHGRLCSRELRMIGLHAAKHVDRLVDFTLLDGKLAVGDQDFNFLTRPCKFCDSMLDDLARLVQSLDLRQQTHQEREQSGAISDAEQHVLTGSHLRVSSHCLDARQLHGVLQHLDGRFVLASRCQHLGLHEVVKRMVANAEVVT
mmetsp:Transcript_5100/g.11019  ORF Transcript_5100/g.11019 Transcript_5100/m.11019 type:complete len:293 (+) Transcript_5100:1517-2395(+)